MKTANSKRALIEGPEFDAASTENLTGRFLLTEAILDVQDSASPADQVERDSISMNVYNAKGNLVYGCGTCTKNQVPLAHQSHFLVPAASTYAFAAVLASAASIEGERTSV